MNEVTQQLVQLGDHHDLRTAISNLCNGDSPVRSRTVDVGFVELVYNAILAPIDAQDQVITKL